MQRYEETDEMDLEPGSLAENCATTATIEKDTLKINMAIKFPKKKPPPAPKFSMGDDDDDDDGEGGLEAAAVDIEHRAHASLLSGVFSGFRLPEFSFLQSVDCVSCAGFFSHAECRQIIQYAEQRGWQKHRRFTPPRPPHFPRPEVLCSFEWADLVDPFFSQAIWQLCGLQTLFQQLQVDGFSAAGVNACARVFRFEKGGCYGRHVDEQIVRQDGAISKFSVKIFLSHPSEYRGGETQFHVPCRVGPVSLDADEGLAVIYPQGASSTVKEETMVKGGVKYVLRCDVMFVKKKAKR